MARKGHISLDLQLPLGSCTSPKHKFTVLNKPNWKWPFLQGFLSSLYFWVTWGKGAVWEMCGWWKKQERNVSPFFFFTTYYIDSSTFNFYSWLLALSSKNGCLCIFVWEHTYAHMSLATNSVWCISLGFFFMDLPGYILWKLYFEKDAQHWAWPFIFPSEAYVYNQTFLEG